LAAATVTLPFVATAGAAGAETAMASTSAIEAAAFRAAATACLPMLPTPLRDQTSSTTMQTKNMKKARASHTMAQPYLGRAVNTHTTRPVQAKRMLLSLLLLLLPLLLSLLLSLLLMAATPAAWSWLLSMLKPLMLDGFIVASIAASCGLRALEVAAAKAVGSTVRLVARRSPLMLNGFIMASIFASALEVAVAKVSGSTMRLAARWSPLYCNLKAAATCPNSKSHGMLHRFDAGEANIIGYPIERSKSK